MTGNSPNAFSNGTPRPQERLAYYCAILYKHLGKVVIYRDNSKRKGHGSNLRARSKHGARQEFERANRPQNEALNSDLQSSQVDSSTPEQDSTSITLNEPSYLAHTLSSNTSSHLVNSQQSEPNVNNVDEVAVNLPNQNNVVNQYRNNRGYLGISKNDREIIDYMIKILEDRLYELNYDEIAAPTLTIPSMCIDGTMLDDDHYYHLANNDSAITKSLRQFIQRLLYKYGLNEQLFIKKELQTNRWFKNKQVVIHYHLAFLWKEIHLTEDSRELFIEELKVDWSIILSNQLKHKLGKILDTSKACEWEDNYTDYYNKVKEAKKAGERIEGNSLIKYFSKNVDDNTGVIEEIQNSFWKNVLPRKWISATEWLNDEVKLRKENDLVRYDLGETTYNNAKRELSCHSDVFESPHERYKESHPRLLVAVVSFIKKGKEKEAEEILDNNFNRSSEDTSEYTSERIKRYSRVWEIELTENIEPLLMGENIPHLSDFNELIILRSNALKVLKINILLPFKGQLLYLHCLMRISQMFSVFDFSFRLSALVPLLQEYQNWYFA